VVISLMYVEYALCADSQHKCVSFFLVHIEFCTFLITTDSASVCTPMIGRMTAQFAGDENTVRSYLEHNIKLELDSKRVRIDNVEESMYVGDRDSLLKSPNAREEVQSNNNSMNLALVFGVLAGVFVLAFALLMARGRRRRQQHVMDNDGELPHSIPTVIISKLGPSQVLRDNISSSSSSETQESVPDNNITSVPPDSDGFRIREVAFPTGVELAASRSAESADDQQLSDGESEMSDAAIANDVQEKENLGVSHLPPLFVVPVETAASKLSKTLQPKRRRRKKKKRRVLKKVSSRSSIDEMETIREDDESIDSEFDGSEYSTDDDEDTMSPQGDSSGAVMEPAEAEAVITPSPIREEPKIRRLPPPWI
jgi:hypothetical protein